MVKIFEQTLSTGWYFKQVDDAEQAWIPVPSIPSVVHQDLLANGEYVLILWSYNHHPELEKSIHLPRFQDS